MKEIYLFIHSEWKQYFNAFIINPRQFPGKAILLTCSVAFLFFSAQGWSQAVGDYRSRQTGNWSLGSTWERWDGSNWVNQSDFPEVAGTNFSAEPMAATTHAVALPAGIVSGDLLLIYWTDEDNSSTLSSTGWTTLYDNVVGNRRR